MIGIKSTHLKARPAKTKMGVLEAGLLLTKFSIDKEPKALNFQLKLRTRQLVWWSKSKGGKHKPQGIGE